MSYTIAEAREIMNETSRILANDAKREKQRVNARAAATTPPPEPEFMDLVLEQMVSRGMRKAQAVRAVAIAKPDLHQTWLREYNEQYRNREHRNREQALARVHARQAR